VILLLISINYKIYRVKNIKTLSVFKVFIVFMEKYSCESTKFTGEWKKGATAQRLKGAAERI